MSSFLEVQGTRDPDTQRLVQNGTPSAMDSQLQLQQQQHFKEEAKMLPELLEDYLDRAGVM